MRSSTPAKGTAVQSAAQHNLDAQGSAASNVARQNAGGPERAAVAPSPEPVSAAANPLPAARADKPADSPAEAQGRRTLSTAFVRVGPDGHLTVELRGGRVMVLRNVVMRPKDYCGTQVLGGKAGGKYCGGYADVAAARPGGAPVPAEPDQAAANPLPS